MVPPGRQVRIEFRQFLVERERPVAAHGQHPDEFLVAEADQIGVLGVKFVHEPLDGGRLMLRDFLDEGPVVQAVNLLELPVFRRQFEYQRFRWIHNSGDLRFGRNPTSRRQHGDFFAEILPVRKQNHRRQDGCQRRRQAVVIKPEAGQRQAGEGEHSRQDAFSRQDKTGQEQARRRSGPAGNQTPAARRATWPRPCRRESATAPARCARRRRPAWPARRGDGYGSIPAHSRRPARPCQIAQHRQPKTGFAQHTPDVARAGAAAFDFTNVPARAGADEIIAGGKATKEISAQHTAGCLKPVGGLQMFNPRHVGQSQSDGLTAVYTRTACRCETKSSPNR